MSRTTLRRWVTAFSTLYIAASFNPCASTATLIANASFEDVSDVNFGQGHLPAGYMQAGKTTPGADTYSYDGSYGVSPGTFGNFIGATAHDGKRFVAGADFGNGAVEAIGAQLNVPLLAGVMYQFDAAIRDSLRPGTFRGGFDILLSPTSYFGDPGAVVVGRLDPTTGVDDWDARSILFAGPPNADSLSYLILAPYTTSIGQEAYIGIDALSLRPVPELRSDAKLAVALLAIATGVRVRAAQICRSDRLKAY